MRQKDDLRLYRDKRDFSHSPEPRARRGKSGKQPIFVIQKHAASTLHYDFRLQVGNVLKSWAVPKGPSTDPSEKRLAVQVEDHPFDYADFEGTIPRKEYGGGTVLVWDAGSYRNLKIDEEGKETMSMPEALRNGHVTVWLDGKKLRGAYSLTRFRVESGKAQWLLIKIDDNATPVL